MRIVAKEVILGGTASTGTVALFSSTEGGDYRVSAYITSTQTANVAIHWTDEIGNQTGNGGGNQPEQDTFVVHCKPGSTVSYSITPSGFSGGDFFDAYLTVEALAAPGF